MRRTIVPNLVNNQTVHVIHEEETVLQAAQIMQENNIGAVIVLNKAGKMAGILTERDITQKIVAEGADPRTTPAQAIMTRNPITVLPSDTIQTALNKMQSINCRHLPVVENDEVVGIVSMKDVYRCVTSELEKDLHQCEAFIFDIGYGKSF